MQQQSGTVTEAGWWTKWDFPLRPWWAVSVWASSTTSFSRFFSSFFVHTLLLSIFSFTHNFIFFKFFFLFSPHSLYTLLPSIFRCTHSFIFLKVFFLLALCTHTYFRAFRCTHNFIFINVFFLLTLCTHTLTFDLSLYTQLNLSQVFVFLLSSLFVHTLLSFLPLHTHTHTRARIIPYPLYTHCFHPFLCTTLVSSFSLYTQRSIYFVHVCIYEGKQADEFE